MNSSSEMEHCESAWEYNRRESTMDRRDSRVRRRAYTRSRPCDGIGRGVVCWCLPSLPSLSVKGRGRGYWRVCNIKKRLVGGRLVVEKLENGGLLEM